MLHCYARAQWKLLEVCRPNGSLTINDVMGGKRCVCVCESMLSYYSTHTIINSESAEAECSFDKNEMAHIRASNKEL